MFYQAMYHELLWTMSYHTMDHIVPVHRQCYMALYHELQGCGHLLPGPVP